MVRPRFSLAHLFSFDRGVLGRCHSHLAEPMIYPEMLGVQHGGDRGGLGHSNPRFAPPTMLGVEQGGVRQAYTNKPANVQQDGDHGGAQGNSNPYFTEPMIPPPMLGVQQGGVRGRLWYSNHQFTAEPMIPPPMLGVQQGGDHGGFGYSNHQFAAEPMTPPPMLGQQGGDRGGLGYSNHQFAAEPMIPPPMVGVQQGGNFGGLGYFNPRVAQPMIPPPMPRVEQGGVQQADTNRLAKLLLPGTMGRPDEYVSVKRHHRILLRRQARDKAGLKTIRPRKQYRYESRHLHANRRPRGSGGQFLKKPVQEEAVAKADCEGHPKGGEETALLQTELSSASDGLAEAFTVDDWITELCGTPGQV